LKCFLPIIFTLNLILKSLKFFVSKTIWNPISFCILSGIIWKWPPWDDRIVKIEIQSKVKIKVMCWSIVSNESSEMVWDFSNVEIAIHKLKKVDVTSFNLKVECIWWSVVCIKEFLKKAWLLCPFCHEEIRPTLRLGWPFLGWKHEDIHEISVKGS
jgi:hypothetical protein